MWRRACWQPQVSGGGRGCPVPGPAGGLPVEHPQLVVHTVRGHLVVAPLLLRRDQVAQHAVYGGNLHHKSLLVTIEWLAGLEKCNFSWFLFWQVGGTYTGHVVSIAHSFREQPVPDLPGEDAGALPLVLRYLPHHSRRGHTGLGAADCSRFDWSGLVISGTWRAQYLAFMELFPAYLPSILETHPLETWSILEISQGRAPWWASSTIFCLVESGRGRPLT